MHIPHLTLTTYIRDGKVGPRRVTPYPAPETSAEDDLYADAALARRRPPLRVRLGQALRRALYRVGL